MKQEPFVQDLPHELSQDELIAKGAELSRTLDQRAHIEAEKKAMNSGFKARIEEQDQIVRRVSECIRTGQELRPTECFERMNTAERTIETVRADTGDVVATRAMTPDEHQLHMDEVLNSMQRNAKRQQQQDAELREAVDAVIVAVKDVTDGNAPLALPENAGDAATATKPKKKSGAQRLREKKAAAEAADKAASKTKNKKIATKKAATAKQDAAPQARNAKSKKKSRPVLERESFLDDDEE